MKRIKIILVTFIILINSILCTGCWNYREIDELSIVAGVAVDKGIKNPFSMTVEIVQVSGGNEIKMKSKIITMEGKTMFDAARNIIALCGKRLYWCHAKVIILSKDIARRGVIKAIEWYNHDSETRESVKVLISREKSAKEILAKQTSTGEIKSFTLDDMIKSQVSLSKAPITDILSVDMESKTKGISTIIAAVNLKKMNKKKVPQLIGTAIIKNDKLIGFLNGEETKDLMFIRDEIKGGILIEKFRSENVPTFVSLEIFKNKTKVKPVVYDKNIKVDLNINTTVAIDEIEGILNFPDDKVIVKFQQKAEKELKKRIETLIKKVQSKYDADIFGFGIKVYEDKSKMWNVVKNNWEEIFKELKVTVKVKINIKNSSMLSKPLKEGD